TAIPAGSTVTGVSIAFTSTQITPDRFPVYEALRGWTETGATWFTFDGVGAWARAGAAGAGDLGTTDLGEIGPVPAAVRTSFALNAAGVQLVQAWADGTRPNHGLAVSSFAASTGATMRDREFATLADRPALTVDYLPPGFDAGIAVDAGLSS